MEPPAAAAVEPITAREPGPRRPVSEPAGAEPPPAEAVPTGNAPEETNVWPDEAAESAFLAESRERGEPAAVAATPAPEEPEPKTLPPLDELVQRIPAETRELMEELFRARFTTVRRVRRADLKT